MKFSQNVPKENGYYVAISRHKFAKKMKVTPFICEVVYFNDHVPLVYSPYYSGSPSCYLFGEKIAAVNPIEVDLEIAEAV